MPNIIERILSPLRRSDCVVFWNVYLMYNDDDNLKNLKNLENYYY